MRKYLLVPILVGSLIGTVRAQSAITSQTIGIYDSNERVLLVPAFIDSVNRYLGRYGPTLVEKRPDYAKMQVEYDYLYDIQFSVADETYEVTVTLAEDVKRKGKAQEIAAHLASGVHRNVEKALIRGTRVRDRTDRDGIR
jgi:hypothetical protein